jgi:guanidinoacetate N-methyltransferase
MKRPEPKIPVNRMDGERFPKWEKNIQSYDVSRQWKKASARFTKEKLEVLGFAVMESWETPYMKDLADIATIKGGTILEIGFGLGISAALVQSHNIEKHIIVEANAAVAKAARAFARKSRRKIRVVEALWQDAVREFPDASIDGILFDSYPLNSEEVYGNHFAFFPEAYRLLREDGVFTYYSDEEKVISERHLKQLQKAGFNKRRILARLSHVSPPPNCEYWKARTIVAPIVFK